MHNIYYKSFDLEVQVMLENETKEIKTRKKRSNTTTIGRIVYRKYIL